ncbi:hypothetical protein D3C78_1796230 [compost metagenome]
MAAQVVVQFFMEIVAEAQLPASHQATDRKQAFIFFTLAPRRSELVRFDNLGHGHRHLNIRQLGAQMFSQQ